MDRNEFINEHRQFIYNSAYCICKRKLEWENDDELSIALIAFNKACDTYNKDKGNFFAYARVLIRNALIDYFRKKPDELLFFSNDDDTNELAFRDSSISDYESETERKNLYDEINELVDELSKYKIDIGNLAKYSPSHRDTRNMLLNIALKCSAEKTVLDSLHIKKALPIKEISLLTSAKPKFLEKWRKYLIALIIILSGDNYIYIKSYLNIKAGENTNVR